MIYQYNSNKWLKQWFVISTLLVWHILYIPILPFASKTFTVGEKAPVDKVCSLLSCFLPSGWSHNALWQSHHLEPDLEPVWEKSNEIHLYESMQINKPVYITLFSNAKVFSSITDSQENPWLVYAFFSSFTFVLSPDKSNFEVSGVKLF